MTSMIISIRVVQTLNSFAIEKSSTWKAKCPIFKLIVAGLRGKVAKRNRTLGVPGRFFLCLHNSFLKGSIRKPPKTDKNTQRFLRLNPGEKKQMKSIVWKFTERGACIKVLNKDCPEAPNETVGSAKQLLSRKGAGGGGV